MINFDLSVTIDRPVADVFSYVSDAANLPRWNSAVQAVTQTSRGAVGAGATFHMVRDLPSGRAENDLLLKEYEPAKALTLQTTAGPTPFTYRYTFATTGASTQLTLDATVETSGLTALLEPLLARGLRSGVRANLDTLKRQLEL